MTKSTITTFSYIVLFFSSLTSIAQSNNPVSKENQKANFELNNGDRVVFLGNSLFENDLHYGYLEFALTSRWPDRNVSFRNIGWAGDNVFGEARSYFTNSPTAYDLLIQQLTTAKPTIVFVAYGAIEALEGEEGLPRFNNGMNQLLDSIDRIGAKAILLSPIPIMSGDSSADLATRNNNLKMYASAISKISSARNKLFINVFDSLQEINKSVPLTENVVHLNENGYYHLASEIEKGLGLSLTKTAITINVARSDTEASVPVKILEPGNKRSNIKFSIDQAYLPLPLPKKTTPIESVPLLKVTGLKKGFYTLVANNSQLITASAKKWKEGVEITHSPLISQADYLRELILKKNELFFHKFRPQNRTYIIGFRSYEQGRHKQGLEDLESIIKWLEGQIELNRMPKPITYQLIQVK